MLSIDLERLDAWRSEFADFPDVLRSLNELEDCDGDVEDAAINLALHAGLTPDNSNQWLLGYAKRYRVVICQYVTHSETEPNVVDLARHLQGNSSCPEILALPVALAAEARGLSAFCEPLKLKLV